MVKEEIELEEGQIWENESGIRKIIGISHGKVIYKKLNKDLTDISGTRHMILYDLFMRDLAYKLINCLPSNREKGLIYDK